MTHTVPDERLARIVNLDDVEALALDGLDPVVASYLLGGAGDEDALRDNREAYRRYRLLPRLSEGGLVSTATTLLGSPISMPLGIAPSAAHGLLDPAGEIATARGAVAGDALYCVSSASTAPVDEIARELDGHPWWYQCYPLSGAAGIGRAADLGYRALVLTVDVPVAGHRDREFRAQRSAPGHALYQSTWRYAEPGFDLTAHMHRTRVTWPDVRRTVAESDVPIVLKGVLTPDDARKAADAGVAAIWVSNHGARQLDRAPAPIDALAGVVEAVGDSVEVCVDGGVRRGVDVATGLALGARAVFTGRSVLFGLAAGGADGVRTVLDQLRKELVNALYMLGADSVAALGPESVMPFRR